MFCGMQFCGGFHEDDHGHSLLASAATVAPILASTWANAGSVTGDTKAFGVQPRRVRYFRLRRGEPRGVACSENRMLPPFFGTPLTCSMISWQSRLSFGRTRNSNG